MLKLLLNKVKFKVVVAQNRYLCTLNHRGVVPTINLKSHLHLLYYLRNSCCKYVFSLVDRLQIDEATSMSHAAGRPFP